MSAHQLLVTQLATCMSLFRHGESNPTYLLEWNNGPSVVLRRKPPGKLLRGAHRVCSLALLCDYHEPLPCVQCASQLCYTLCIPHSVLFA